MVSNINAESTLFGPPCVWGQWKSFGCFLRVSCQLSEERGEKCTKGKGYNGWQDKKEKAPSLTKLWWRVRSLYKDCLLLIFKTNFSAPYILPLTSTFNIYVIAERVRWYEKEVSFSISFPVGEFFQSDDDYQMMKFPVPERKIEKKSKSQGTMSSCEPLDEHEKKTRNKEELFF